MKKGERKRRRRRKNGIKLRNRRTIQKGWRTMRSRNRIYILHGRESKGRTDKDEEKGEKKWRKIKRRCHM